MSVGVHRQLSTLHLANKKLSGAQHEFEEAWKLASLAHAFPFLLRARFSTAAV